MLIDMHAHSSGISRCCKADAADVMLTAKSNGIDALILCNHYQESYVTSTAAEFARKYIEEFNYAVSLEKSTGVKLFFGIEVTAKRHGDAHILIYGMQPDFLRAHPEIYDYPLEKMHALVKAAGGLVVQAHPFRGGGHVLDLRYLDGIEVNCHPLYDATHCDEILSIAAGANKLVTCGGDYHADCYRAICGTYFPDGVRDNAGIIAHLTGSDEIKMHVHELRCENHSDVVYAKPGRNE